MGKQTMGTPAHTLQFRNDHKMYRLQTPQSPLVRPHAYDNLNFDDYPLGTNAVVAVISYTVSSGYFDIVIYNTPYKYSAFVPRENRTLRGSPREES